MFLAAAAFGIKKRRGLGATTRPKSYKPADMEMTSVTTGATMVQNPGLGDDGADGCAAAAGAGTAAAAAAGVLAAGLVLASHLPIVGGIATLALQMKALYDKQLGGPANAAIMSQWAGHLSAVMAQLEDANAAAQVILGDMRAQLMEMLAAAKSYDRQGKLRQWLSSAKCFEQQQNAQAHLHRLLSALQLGVAGQSLTLQIKQMDITLEVDAKVDALLASSDALTKGQAQLLEQGRRRSQAEQRQGARDRAASAFSIPRADVHLQLDEVLGRGGGGIVYKATYHGEEVAAKVVDLRGLPIKARGVVLDNVHREVALMTRLHSPRIVRIIGICECADEQELIVIMTLARGGSLRQQLDAAADSGAPLDVQRAIKQMHDAAVGMAFLHSKSVLHRDVKSANLLLDENGRVLVSDFGISKQSSNATTTMGAGGGGSVKGSAPWMAPEAHEGEPTTAAGDVFGFAVVMWEIMSRQTPWEGKQLSQIVRFVCDKPAPQNRPPLEAVGASFPAPLLALMQECWEQDPAARPSFADIARRLGVLEVAHPSMASKEEEKKKKKKKGLWR